MNVLLRLLDEVAASQVFHYQPTARKIELIKIFGVPLIVRKLTVKDCAPLLEKVVMKVNGWAAKTLSYAGKAQLVQATLFHIKNYWAWHFLLPKQAIKLVNQMCMRSLWKGQNEKVKVARVTWEQICKPKNGGLILKDLASWNKACPILIQVGSLWIAWINAYMLRGRHVMLLPLVQNSSWGWKKLMCLINQARGWPLQGQRYQVSKVWQEIRPKASKVPWSRVIRCPIYTPKHLIISWLATLDRLLTKNKVRT
ncbi:reverse transcriptase [Gossypium australe]|uniref:Reverse transcriptase n=1 Tax=Gossypium australe TaxID=47621 RepID=A0A5B6W375_9ROSI|nr:reverse transcriptase [Gossypium australe]